MREKPLILVVDDEKDLLEIASIKLQAVGYDVVVAYNGKEAIDAAHKLHPDLILMDINMPVQTGTDAALAIKQDADTKNIKIAFLSNMKDPWPRVKSERDVLSKTLGMEDFIDKTGDLTQFVEKVHEILART